MPKLNKIFADSKVKILSIALILIAIHLLLFSFNFRDDDSQCWLGVSKYFAIINRSATIPMFHCLYSPGIPLLASVVSGGGVASAETGYLVINLVAYLATAVIFYKFLVIVSNPTIALVSSILFLIDFNAQWYVFSVMPSSVTWLFIVLLLYGVVSVHQKKEINFKDVVFWSIVAGYGTLVKTDIGFLTLPYVWLLFTKPTPKRLPKFFVALVFLLLPILSFYTIAYLSTNRYPWSSMAEGLTVLKPTVQSRILAFIGAYLYSIPLIILGLISGLPFKKKFFVPLMLCAISLLLPILIWPAVLPRFMYNLFPVLLPIAAVGVLKIAQLNTKHQQLITAILLFFLAFWHMARLYMTFNGLTHLQFIKLLM